MRSEGRLRQRVALAVLIALPIALWLILRRTTTDPDATAPAGDGTEAPHGLVASSSGRPLRYGGAPRRAVELAGAQAVEAPGRIGTLEGRVLSRAGGQPIANAELTFALGDLRTVRSDAEGRFTFAPERAGTYELALVTAAGYQPFAPELGHSPMLFAAREGAGLRGAAIYLDPAVRYTATVVDAGAEAVAGASVRIVSTSGAGSWSTAQPALTSDARGEVVFSAPDGAIVEASHPDHAPGRAEVDTAVQISKRMLIRLGHHGAPKGYASIRGRVVDVEGNPVPDALVSARFDADNPASPEAQLVPDREALADAEGAFELAELDAGRRYVVVAAARDLAPAEQRGVEAPSEVTLTLAGGVGLFGSVRDAATGAPIPAFVVVVARPAGALEMDVVTVEPTLDPEGRYEIPALPVGSYRVVVSAQGYAASAPRAVEVGDDDVEASFTLGRGGTVRGRVFDDAGPVAGARASLEGRFGGSSVELPLSASSTSDAEGRYEITGVGAGLASIFVSAEAHHARVLGGLTVAEGQVLALDVELTPVGDDEAPHIEHVGIGAVLSAKGDVMLIGGVVAGGGAAEVGLVEGDAITAVEGLPVGELGFADTVQRIRGPEGTFVRLTVLKVGAEEPTVIDVPRRRIKAP